MSIADRYSSAVRSSNLRSQASTQRSDSDVLGGAGFAGGRGKAIGVALMRLLQGGDKKAAPELVRLMAGALIANTVHTAGTVLTKHEARDIAQAVLDWFRDNACRACGGHGFRFVGGQLGEGRVVKTSTRCPVCRGTGKRQIDPKRVHKHEALARWLAASIEQELATTGAAVMAALAPKLEL